VKVNPNRRLASPDRVALRFLEAANLSAQALSILMGIEDWETGKANRPPSLFSSRAISVAAKLEVDGYYESREDGPRLTAKGKAALAESASAPTVWKRTIRDLGDDVKRGWITLPEKNALVQQLGSAQNQYEADAIRNEYLKRKGH
jgi:hypothetical protein